MNHQDYSLEHTERHLTLWIYLLPIIGIIPAFWTLYRPGSNTADSSEELREQRKISRLAISLGAVWLAGYSLFSLGAASAGEILSFRLLYANAILTTGYFLSCTFLLTRLNKKGLSYVSKHKKSAPVNSGKHEV